MRLWMVVCMVLTVLGSLHAGQPRISESFVRYGSGRDSVRSMLCVPEGKGPFPALILIHEWWGLNDWVKQNARDFAGRGYVSLAIDLYRGKVTSSPDEAHELMRGIPEDRAVRDLKAAATYLKSRADVDGRKIGSIGWCMGGKYSLETAFNVPDLAACVICYGSLVSDSSTIAAIPCPILGIFGAEDRGISPDDVHEFEQVAKAQGKDVQAIVYPGVGHAFMNANNKQGYKKQSAQEAWSQIYSFLKRTLKSN